MNQAINRSQIQYVIFWYTSNINKVGLIQQNSYLTKFEVMAKMVRMPNAYIWA